MKTTYAAALCVMALLLLAGCNGLRPQVNAGYYIENLPDSKTTVLIGTNNSQANAIHAGIGEAAGAAEGEKAEADKNLNTAKSSGLFVNNNVGDRAAEIDATTALEVLKNVRGTSAGQGQTTTKGNESPATGGAQTQTPTQTESRTVNTPVAVSQQGAVAQTGATPVASEQAIPAVFSLGIKQAAQPVTAAQKSAVDSAVASDKTEKVPDGLDMSLADWKTLKAAYIECPECLSLTDAELSALKAATGK
ncbi:MAG: hypothetical protein WCY59_03825 [Anaerovoracaceae bacterium]|jgi:hypothetical protein